MTDVTEKYYSLEISEVFQKLDSTEEGLSDKEASLRLKKYGPNKIQEKKQKSVYKLILEQLNNPIIYLLAAATIISFIFKDIPEAIAIIVVIVLNTIIGFWMEYQAMVSVNALKKLDKLNTYARRNNSITDIDADQIVPGDIIELESGDMVPADARIINASELSVDESALTGESVPVAKNEERKDKDTPLAERSCMLYKGTAVTNGKAVGLITATGGDTEIGKISEMVNEEDEEEIPLNQKLEKLSHKLIWVTLGLAAVFFLIGWLTGKEIYQLLQTSIAWTVAAIPEGLAIVASIALARGMLRLSKQNVLVKKLAAVETLGETTVILTDKTGTLTENELTVGSLIYPDESLVLSNDEEKNDEAYNKAGENLTENENLKHIFQTGILCNDAERKEDETWKGDPLDVSLHQFSQKLHTEKYKELLKKERIHEDPFDSESKFMGAIHELDDNLYISGKGAAEPILKRSSSYLKDGNITELNEAFRQEWIQKNEALSAEGFRVIAFAYREAGKQEKEALRQQEDFLQNLTFAGFIGFLDPPRYDTKPAIEKCKKAGIRIVMVTGDHPEIAKNIGQKVELIADDNAEVIRANELKENKDLISNTQLFARVNPKQKYQLVEHFKKDGDITAMTGDGVNDAPALRKADIGIAMGERGSQVAREVADMILTDDSFPSIVDAIEQGRIIFGNIRKFIIYQLSNHLAEIIIIAGISFSMFYLPLLPLQLLFLNLLSDVFPALALGIGKGDSSVMEKPPKHPDEPIVVRQNWIATITYGSVMALTMIATFLMVVYYLNEPKELAGTVTFFGVAFAQLLNVFNMRDSSEPVFNNQVIRNKYVWFALILCLTLLMAGYFIPLFNKVLLFHSMTGLYWLIAVGASFASLLLAQVLKWTFKF